VTDEPPSARKLPALVYERAFLSVVPRVKGVLALRFFRLLYPGFSVGPASRCWGTVQVTMGRGSSITIGEKLWMVSDSRRAGIALHSPCKLRTMAGAHLSIGDHVGLNGTSITCRRRIDIGSGTIVAANVVIVDSDFHRQWPPEERFFEPGQESDRPVSIGRNVWIGMGSMVLKGATIGDGSIIGAGSVVSGAIPSDVLAAGVPARVIRTLSPDEPAEGY
jgi:acetyltransferase-like isoleucine patch superfamily enzyme